MDHDRPAPQRFIKRLTHFRFPIVMGLLVALVGCYLLANLWITPSLTGAEEACFSFLLKYPTEPYVPPESWDVESSIFTGPRQARVKYVVMGAFGTCSVVYHWLGQRWEVESIDAPPKDPGW